MSNFTSLPTIGQDDDGRFDGTVIAYIPPLPKLGDAPAALSLSEIVGDVWMRLDVWCDGEGTVVLSVEAASILAAQLQEWVDRKRGVTRHEGIGEFHKDTSHNPEAV